MKPLIALLLLCSLASAQMITVYRPDNPNVILINKDTGARAIYLGYYDPNSNMFFWTTGKFDFAGTYFLMPLDPNDPNLLNKLAWKEITISGVVPMKTLKPNKYGCTPSLGVCLKHQLFLTCPHGCVLAKKHKE